MTKIKNYVVNATPTFNDKVIGTDVDSNNFTKNFRIGDIASLIEGGDNKTLLVSGGVVWLSGLTYAVSNLQYFINGVYYTATGTNVTLSDADASNPRIDVIYADVNGNIDVENGSPSANPVKPFIDGNSQIQISFALIDPNQLTPTGVSENIVYNEDTGVPSEFDAFESTSGTRIELDSTDNPYIGNKCILVQKPFNGDNISFVSDSDFLVSDISSISFYIKLKNNLTPESKIKLSLYNGGLRVSGDVSILSGDFGLVGNNTTDYQLVIVPLNAFNFLSGGSGSIDFNELRFYFSGLEQITLSLDYIRLVSGVPNPIQGNTYLSLLDTFDDTYIGKANYIPIVIDNEQGLKLVDYETLFPTENFIYGVRETSNVSGTKVLDLNKFTDFHYTMTSDTTFTFNGMPSGNLVKRFKIKLTGNFTPTFPSFLELYGDTYNGVFKNDILGEISNGNASTLIGELITHNRS